MASKLPCNVKSVRCRCFSHYRAYRYKYPFVLEGNIEAEVHACVRAKRYKLLACLAEDVVHTHKDVHTLRVNVQYPAAACGEAVYGKVHTTVNPLQRSNVGAQAALSPCILAVEAGRAKEAEVQLAVERECILATEVKRSAYTCRAAALVVVVRKVGKLGNLVRVLVALSAERVRLLVAVFVVLIYRDTCWRN